MATDGLVGDFYTKFPKKELNILTSFEYKSSLMGNDVREFNHFIADSGAFTAMASGKKIDDSYIDSYIEWMTELLHNRRHVTLFNEGEMDMNKAIQRSLTKALARHGLGLYIYAGEDLPWTEEEAKAREDATEKAGYNKKPQKPAQGQEGQSKAKKVADLTEKAYNAWVEFAAMGKNTKDGIPARDGFINTFRPNEKELEDFDKAVFRFQLDNGINPEEGTKQASSNL
jgi:hypothetical protein